MSLKLKGDNRTVNLDYKKKKKDIAVVKIKKVNEFIQGK